MSWISEEDRTQLWYFYTQKGDVTRAEAYTRNKPFLDELYPELEAARKQLLIAERTLEAIMRRIHEES